MYVRRAKNRDEVWLLDRIEELGLVDPAFRSRDYVIALDEETGTKTGFGRIRIPPGEEFCEVTTVGVLAECRDSGVGAHVVERLVEMAGDRGFETVYAFTESGGYCSQFGFRPVEEGDLPEAAAERLATVREEAPDAVGVRLDVERFRMPDRLRERFKRAGDHQDEAEAGAEESPEDFGIDPEEATYKYDTGR